MTLREIEDIKIQCAKKHFEALEYEAVENAPLAEKPVNMCVNKITEILH